MLLRLILACLLLFCSDMLSAHARALKVQKISCTEKSKREYCTSEKGRALDGRIAIMRDDGSIAGIGEFDNGYRNGESFVLDDKRRMVERTVYKKGVMDGVNFFYHDNGKIWISAPYVDGLLHGSVDIYDKKGKLRGKLKYYRGNLRSGYCFSRHQRKIKYPNRNFQTKFNQLITCGLR